jgi:hypothetical protein
VQIGNSGGQCHFECGMAAGQSIDHRVSLQDAHGMMDDSNWSTPLTHQAFKDATDKFPIGACVAEQPTASQASDSMRCRISRCH